MTRQIYYERTYLTLVPTPRRSLAHWTRQRLVDIHVELQVLRADLARLQRQATRVDRCHQCALLATITVCEDGNYRCRRCMLAPREETA